MLSLYNLRLGLPEAVWVDTRSRHETRLLRDYDQDPLALTREQRGPWIVDRAFIDAPFWDAKKRTLQITMATRMKAHLRVDYTEGPPIAAEPANAGVLRDPRLTLSGSR